ncbi:MAG: dihydroneopterin aldolase [Deltaproteobacteria bacterium]|nr:dihydroneopterin aldolase [Deltaproteobacteria bacterium]
MDTIELTDFSVPCIIGILPHERVSPQALSFVVKMGLELDDAAGGDLDASVDYAAVAAWLRFLAIHGKWRLLESLGAAAARLILLPPAPEEARAKVSSLVLTLRKPHVLGGGAVPGIVLRREAGWATRKSLQLAPGVEGVLLQGTPDTQAWRVHLDPGVRWRLPHTAVAARIAGSLHDEGGEAPLTGALRAEGGATLLVVARPSLVV